MKVRVTSLGVKYDLDLPITVGEIPVTPPPDAAVFSIAASPASITLGQSATVTCSFERVGGAWLLYAGVVKPLAGPVSVNTVAPLVTTTYTLRVKLADGTMDESKKATIAVTPAPTPQPTGAPFLGVNTIVSKPSIFDAASKGCRAFLVIDSEMEARQIKAQYPEAVVVARRWTGNEKLNGAQIADRIGAANDGVIYELYNEQDNWAYGTVAQITERINYELDAVKILRARGVRVCIGGYSMGTPTLENPDIAAQVARCASVYNNDAGVFISMHLYSPNMTHVPDIWYERRYEMLFTKCGFNPALRKVIATETGVDEGGVGGFPAHNATTAQFENWCKVTQAAHTQPIVVNGASYPSPYIAGMLFQYSQNTNNSWRGYEVASWIGSLQARGWK